MWNGSIPSEKRHELKVKTRNAILKNFSKNFMLATISFHWNVLFPEFLSSIKKESIVSASAHLICHLCRWALSDHLQLIGLGGEADFPISQKLDCGSAFPFIQSPVQTVIHTGLVYSHTGLGENPLCWFHCRSVIFGPPPLTKPIVENVFQEARDNSEVPMNGHCRWWRLNDRYLLDGTENTSLQSTIGTISAQCFSWKSRTTNLQNIKLYFLNVLVPQNIVWHHNQLRINGKNAVSCLD